MSLDREILLHLFSMMLRIRAFEERIVYLYAHGEVPGLAHLYVGEEAVAAGVCTALRRDDWITSTHRGHGHVLAKGADPKYMMAELFGKKTGYCKGKGGSMHIADMKVGVLGANGIAGGGLPIAVGAGWSSKWRGTDQVTACFFGDDASNNGTFHESLNLASVHRLPVIFVCENNLYGISVCQAKHQAVTDVACRAAGYNMQGHVVDGNDVLEVYRVAEKAVKQARSGGGPTLIECKTYRWRGHHEGDPNQGARYRTKEEIETWKKKCPLRRLSERLLHDKMVTQEELTAMEKSMSQEIDSAVKFAMESEFPAVNELYDDVYCN